MKQIQQSLFPSLPASRAAPVLRGRVPSAVPKLAVSRRGVPLWLAVHLPQLSLETLLRRQKLTMPQAVIEATAGNARIAAADDRAAAAGIVPGMTLAAAWALLPQLEIHERDIAQEQDLLRRLAMWGNSFTPICCIDEQAVLLEVRGSLSLFGGASTLHGAVRDGLQRSGFTINTALAPTPRAALWLARAAQETHVDQPDSLSAMLGKLPLAVTGFDAALLEKLHGLGVRRIADLLRLPRDGFARRYSPRVLRELDQALGRVPDVRRPLPAPKQFVARFDLSYEINETARLLYPVEQLLDELADYLQTTQQGVSRLQLQLIHRDKTCTNVPLGFATVTRNTARMHDLMEQKLESVELPAPVLEIVLRAQELTALAGADRELFAEQRDDGDWPQLVERLRTRLGADAVSSIEQCEDHRPECAWRFVAPGCATELAGLADRPHWLLEEPQPLRVQDGKPVLDGSLQILDGPERIETGWWDAADIARDYYVARDRHGRRVWICREVRSGRWWWQGIFAGPLV